jgi:hypothetical protein
MSAGMRQATAAAPPFHAPVRSCGVCAQPSVSRGLYPPSFGSKPGLQHRRRVYRVCFAPCCSRCCIPPKHLDSVGSSATAAPAQPSPWHTRPRRRPAAACQWLSRAHAAGVNPTALPLVTPLVCPQWVTGHGHHHPSGAPPPSDRPWDAVAGQPGPDLAPALACPAPYPPERCAHFGASAAAGCLGPQLPAAVAVIPE